LRADDRWRSLVALLDPGYRASLNLWAAASPEENTAMSALPSVDSAAFRAFEQAGWESVVEAYDAAFRALTAQTIGPLLDAVGIGPGMQVLDEATGPGYVAAAAAARGADVTAVDFAAAMVAEARQQHPGLDMGQADVEALPLTTDLSLPSS
jgi:protein-L-isoaspartate O-methyltransferase